MTHPKDHMSMASLNGSPKIISGALVKRGYGEGTDINTNVSLDRHIKACRRQEAQEETKIDARLHQVKGLQCSAQIPRRCVLSLSFNIYIVQNTSRPHL